MILVWNFVKSYTKKYEIGKEDSLEGDWKILLIKGLLFSPHSPSLNQSLRFHIQYFHHERRYST